MSSDIRVIAVVVEREGRYLICQRPAHKRHGGLWEFPGGKVEHGESDLEAARRELAEELSLRVCGIGATELVLRDPGSPFVIQFMRVMTEGEPVCHEHARIRWASLGDLLDFPLAPSDRRFAEYLTAADQVR